MTTKRLEPVVVRVVNNQVLLDCACGFRLTQQLRAPIADRCLKCCRPWNTQA